MSTVAALAVSHPRSGGDVFPSAIDKRIDDISLPVPSERLCFDPVGDRLSDLQLFADVLVVPSGNHCRLEAPGRLGKALYRRFKKKEFLFAAKITFVPKKASSGQLTRRIGGFDVCVPKKSTYSRGL